MCTKTLKENSGIFFPTIHTKGINIIIILTLSCLFENNPKTLPIWSANKKKISLSWDALIELICGLHWINAKSVETHSSHETICQCAPASVSLWQRANTWNVSFELYTVVNLCLSTQLITLIKITLLYYPTDTPPVSLETYPCYAPASGLLHNYHHDNWLNP